MLDAHVARAVSGGHRSRSGSGAVLRTSTGSALRTAMWLSARYQSCSGEVKRLRRIAAEAASGSSLAILSRAARVWCARLRAGSGGATDCHGTARAAQAVELGDEQRRAVETACHDQWACRPMGHLPPTAEAGMHVPLCNLSRANFSMLSSWSKAFCFAQLTSSL